MRLSNDAKEFYQSRVIETSEKYLFVEIPLHYVNHHPCVVDAHANVWIEYHTPDGATCRYQSQVHGLINMPMKVWQIDLPDNNKVFREQRREFVRVLADLEVSIEVQQASEPLRVQVFSRDISGGGMSLLLPKTVILRSGEQIEIKFILPVRNRRIEVSSRCFVVRVSERNDRGFASASVKFVDLKESMRQQIIQYTFLRQRLLSQLT